MTDARHDTIMRLLVQVGNGYEKLLDKRMRGLSCRRVLPPSPGTLDCRS